MRHKIHSIFSLNDKTDLVLDTRVLALGVFPDEDSVDIVVRRLVPLDGHAGTDVGKEVEGASERQVERDVALADW